LRVSKVSLEVALSTMFSGLTSQVSSWMGKKGGEEVVEAKEEGTEPTETPVASPTDPQSVSAEAEVKSPTKGGSRLEMLGNIGHLGGSVKTQMSSWLGGGIPGLRKTEGGEATAPEEPVPAPLTPTDGKLDEKDDDNSSATGGADSDAHISEGEGTPTEDKDGAQAFEGVSTKAFAGAKSFGSFLYSAVNKAGKTVSEASAKIKKTVEENSLLVDFNKEQEAFIKEKNAKGGGAAVPPWVGLSNEETVKEEVLSLSTDRRNFVRPPPEGVDFHFDYDIQYPIAMSILIEDPNLEKMRFELVPKIINEENFWQNYFYRVSLICQANAVSSMAQERSRDRTSSVEVEPAERALEEHKPHPPKAKEDLSPQEFVSDTFTASSADIEEVKEGMRQLGIDSKLKA